MKIGILHYQIGSTDGVSLEIEKWKRVLNEMGHEVYLAAGDLGTAEGTYIEEMYHHRADARRLYRSTFQALAGYPNEEAYRAELMYLAGCIEEQVRAFIHENQIDFLIVENLWSVAVNPAASVAIGRLVQDLGIPTLGHHHDFYWEREDGIALTCGTAIEVADRYLPPRGHHIEHIVINSIAQRELAERKGIPSTVVPNVFDFASAPWIVDDYNRDLRERIGLRPNDVMVLQATRIIPRKGIEIAVDLVRALDMPERRARLRARGLYDGRPFDDDSRIVLVLAGYARDDLTGGYLQRLKHKLERSDIDAIFIEEMVAADRQMDDGEKIYSLWDTYVHADFVTYPSFYEGWGNQLLETLRARLPFALFEYPVYRADIAHADLRVVSLGSKVKNLDDLGLVQVEPEIIDLAADEAVQLLTDKDLRRAVVDHNFEAGRRHYSLGALRRYLSDLVPPA
ncbi:MAG: glycosyltransferase family 4 protein [Anaerolineae bacterium]|jgi:glycosyltransferase involved in cell wall biosynthesis